MLEKVIEEKIIEDGEEVKEGDEIEEEVEYYEEDEEEVGPKCCLIFGVCFPAMEIFL